MKKKKQKKLICIVAAALVLLLGGIFTYKMLSNDKEEPKKEEKKKTEEPKKSLKVVDLNSSQRVFAVSIGNTAAARPQSGIQDAFIIYNIVVEGGITRLLALFRDTDVSAIGPIRSARHYFLDYVMENDALFVHCGWSPQAQSDISSLKISNLNLESNISGASWRSKDKSAPHNLYTSMEKLINGASKKKYDVESDELLLSYSESELDMSNGNDATNILVGFGGSFNTTYKYDAENKVYLRSIGSSEHKDALTKETLKVKNIIMYGLDYSGIKGDTKGRQNLDNIGTGKGYYATDGKYIPITWKKDSRNAKTKYFKEDGTELIVNDGNTVFELYPVENKVTFS